jgi:hypothetical protein
MDRRAAKLGYKLALQPMGVFQLRNTANDKVFIDASTNVPGKINRHKFQLNAGMHPSKSLQQDWNDLGPDVFEFETLETVEPRASADYDYAADIECLETLWLEKLEPYGERGYNEQKKTRTQRLRMIAANRRDPVL